MARSRLRLFESLAGAIELLPGIFLRDSILIRSRAIALRNHERALHAQQGGEIEKNQATPRILTKREYCEEWQRGKQVCGKVAVTFPCQRNRRIRAQFPPNLEKRDFSLSMTPPAPADD